MCITNNHLHVLIALSNECISIHMSCVYTSESPAFLCRHEAQLLLKPLLNHRTSFFSTTLRQPNVDKNKKINKNNKQDLIQHATIDTTYLILILQVFFMLPNHLWPCDSNMGLLGVSCGVWHWQFGIWSFGFHQLKGEALIELVPVNLTLPRSDWGNTLSHLLASFSWSWAICF